ncbi:GNAT family N-acetyltransferase, partial [Campylobacter coli]|nr:GNAT family N-acetyltransferase [Campylobacter coli]
MFKKAFYKGFKLSNYYGNFGTIEEKILKQEFILQKYKNNN